MSEDSNLTTTLQLLDPCVTASSKEELILALENLSENIKSLDSTGGGSSRDQKQQIASFLVKEITVSSLSSETLQKRFDKCLEACGLLLVVTDVYVPILLEIAQPKSSSLVTKGATTTTIVNKKNGNVDASTAEASGDDNDASTNKDDDDSSSFYLQTVLQQIRRLFLSSPDSSEHILIKLLIQEYEKQIDTTTTRKEEEEEERISPTVITTTTKSRTASSPIKHLCSTILRLPVQIAAACHTKQLMLPTWAIRSRFYTRLVECAMVASLWAVTNHNNDGDKDNIPPIMNATQQYVTSLVPVIMNYGGGGGSGINSTGDPVALGLYRSYQRILATGDIMLGNNDIRSGSTSGQEQQELLFSRLIFQSMKALLPNVRQCAMLLRSILKQSISTMPAPIEQQLQKQQQLKNKKQQTRQRNLSPYKHHIISYLQVTCQDTLQYSRQIRDAFIRFVILSPSSSSSSSSIPHQILDFEPQCVAILLSKCNQNCSFATSDDDEDDDDSDTDTDDDNDSSTIVKNVLRKSMELVAQTWCETLFVHHTDTKQQQYVTEFLRTALLFLQTQEGDKDSNNDYNLNAISSLLISCLLRGVSVRLDSSSYDIRKDGMVIGELLSKQLGQELHFDELSEKDRDEKNNYDILNLVSKDLIKFVPNDDLGEEIIRNRGAPTVLAVTLDPDEEYVSDDSSDEGDDNGDYMISADSSCSSPRGDIYKRSGDGGADSEDDANSSLCYSDDDNVLLPYNLEDDEEDLRETQRPFYLRDCLDLLRASNEDDNAYSSHQTALQEVTKLVRSKPVDLHDLASSLAKELLYMENKFNIARFTELRQSGLVALAVEEPVSVSRVLIGDVFENIGLGTRLECLVTLEQAAYELSGAKALDESRKARKKQFQQDMTTNEPKISGNRRLVHKSKTESPQNIVEDGTNRVERAITSIERRTRRWGQSRQKTMPSVTVSNRFGPIAPLQFYSLLEEFVKCKEDSSLWSGANGSRLLSSCLITLATFVECSGMHSGTDLLAKHLFELAWSFRSIEAQEVRSAVLVALANCIPFLNPVFFVNVLNGESLDGFSEFLSKSSLDDPDQDCRRLARGIAQNMGAAMSALELGMADNNLGFSSPMT